MTGRPKPPRHWLAQKYEVQQSIGREEARAIVNWRRCDRDIRAALVASLRLDAGSLVDDGEDSLALVYNAAANLLEATAK